MSNNSDNHHGSDYRCKTVVTTDPDHTSYSNNEHKESCDNHNVGSIPKFLPSVPLPGHGKQNAKDSKWLTECPTGKSSREIEWVSREYLTRDQIKDDKVDSTAIVEQNNGNDIERCSPHCHKSDCSEHKYLDCCGVIGRNLEFVDKADVSNSMVNKWLNSSQFSTSLESQSVRQKHKNVTLNTTEVNRGIDQSCADDSYKKLCPTRNDSAKQSKIEKYSKKFLNHKFKTELKLGRTNDSALPIKNFTKRLFCSEIFEDSKDSEAHPKNEPKTRKLTSEDSIKRGSGNQIE